MVNFKIPKIRSKKHRKFVSERPCIITGIVSDANHPHHLLRVDGKAMGTKSCDRWCVPLQWEIHNALHKSGDEIAFFANHGLDYEIVKLNAINLCKMSPCKKINSIWR